MLSSNLNSFILEQKQQQEAPIAFISPKQKQLLIIKDIAISSLKEFTITLAFTGITCIFVASSAIPTLLLITIGTIVLNTVIRSITGYIAYELHQAKKLNSDQEDIQKLQFWCALLQYLCPISFSLLDATTRSILVHEAGHAFTVHLLYQNARTKIEIFPLKGGVTWYWAGPLSKVGEFFGQKYCHLIFSAAGPAAAIFIATIDLGLSHYFKQEHPELHRYFLCAAISSIAQHILYALSALLAKNPRSEHDFIQLWKLGGIHPLLSVICIVALPIIVKSILFYLEVKSINP